MKFGYSYEMMAFTLCFTLFLLVILHINHSRMTQNYRILKFCLQLLVVNQLLDMFRTRVLYDGIMYSEAALYVIFVGYYLTETTIMLLIAIYLLLQFPKLAAQGQLLFKVFFFCESVSVILLATTVFTGFIYRIKDGVFLTGIADECLLLVRLAILTAFLLAMLLKRRSLAPKMFQNWVAVLVMAVLFHLVALCVDGVDVFGVFANLLLATAFFLFHSGTYEEGTARMGADMYRSELDYRLAKEEDFYVYEIKIRNYEQLVERRHYTEEALDGLYGMLVEKMVGAQIFAMVFQKDQTRLGVITKSISAEDAEAFGAKLSDWLNGFFAGRLVFSLVSVHCPQYAANVQDVERLMRFLQKKCPENGHYFCHSKDADEFQERNKILRLLHSMHLEKQDVVLFGRPIIECRSARAKRFEVLCRLQMAGSGIIHSEHVIRLAEQYGYIHTVNMAVLGKVCDFLMTDTAIREGFQVSLHISSEELENSGFADDVLAIIKDYALIPKTLRFEVTMLPEESNIDRMQKVMTILRQHQIEFTLTDFDPSLVNFESIARLPFETIKFERHCVMRACSNAKTYDVMGMLVDLFKEHGFLVAFKGIDNEELLDTAISLGADFVQGEKYTKPFPLEQIEEQYLR